VTDEPGGGPGAAAEDHRISARDHRTAIIVCGGHSSRYGRDKALVEFEGRTLLARSIETARAVAGQVLLAVGSEPRYEDFGIPIVLDAVPDRGPLAGMVAALERAEREFFVTLAVDLPFVTPFVVEGLFSRLSGDLVIPRTRRGLEPLCLVGRARPCLEAARRLLESPDPAVKALAEQVTTVEYDVEAAGIPPACFMNVNPPEDLQRALRSRGPNQR
jgi:molybdopterin-guanine dinucleotide biosynthesis protein A